MVNKLIAPKTNINVSNILFENRNIFLHSAVNDESSSEIIKQLISLDNINNKPIYFWLNSPGGSVSAGFAITNTMQYIKSKVITIINSEVCSMGGHISVCGNERWIVSNGVFMVHDMSGGVSHDYSLKVKDRAIFIEQYYQLLEANMKKHTKLSQTQLDKSRSGELWLFANDCLKYGIVDKII